MIVNYTGAGWQIITQRSHGLLAAQICAQWRKDRQPARWVETLIATAEHDDVFNEFENNKLLDDNHAPLNFKATDFDGELAGRLIDLAATKSAYIALLVSRHISFVHGDDPKAAGFIKKLDRLEQDWRKTASVTAKEVGLGYALLEFCDAFSLLLCQQLVQPEGRKIEISKGPDRQSYTLHASGENLIVSPWPFEQPSFQVSYESRTLGQLTFTSTAEFQEAIKAAPVHSHVLTLHEPA